MRNNRKIITSNLILLLLLMLSFNGNLFAQLSADNDGNLEVSPMNGGLKYSYPISNNSIDGYPITVKVNYVDNVLHKQFLEYHFYQAGDKYNYVYPIYRSDGTRYFDSTTITVEADAQYWDYAPLSKPAWIMGVNGFAINVFKKTGGFIGRGHPDDFLVEGYDFCNRMSVLQKTNADVIKILKDDGSVLELRNVRPMIEVPLGNNYDISDIDKLKDSSYYTGKYYEAGTNPSGYATVEYNYEAEAIPFVRDTLYNNIPLLATFKNAMRTRILKYYKGDGLEYVFKEYIVPYGANWWKVSKPSTMPNSLDAYVRQYPGVYPTIFYLDAINSSEKCLTKFTKKGHDYLNKDSLVYGRVPITEFANHKFTLGGDEATIQVFDKTYRLMLRRPNDDVNYLPSMFASIRNDFSKPSVYAYGHEPDSVPAPSVVERFIRKIVDPSGRELFFAYGGEMLNVDAPEEFSYIDSSFINMRKSGVFNVSDWMSWVRLYKDNKEWKKIGTNEENHNMDYLCFIYDNSKVIKIKSKQFEIEKKIYYNDLKDDDLFRPISEIIHYERNGAKFDPIRTVSYSFSKGNTSSSVTIYDHQLKKTDNMLYEYKKYTTIPPQGDSSYINPLKEYNIKLPSKVTTTRQYWDEARNTPVADSLLTETEYQCINSIHYYPIS